MSDPSGATNGDWDPEDEPEFIQCPHEMIRATCVGVCMCPCEPCAPSRPSVS